MLCRWLLCSVMQVAAVLYRVMQVAAVLHHVMQVAAVALAILVCIAAVAPSIMHQVNGRSLLTKPHPLLNYMQENISHNLTGFLSDFAAFSALKWRALALPLLLGFMLRLTPPIFATPATPTTNFAETG